MQGQENQGYFAYQSRLFSQGGLSSRQRSKLLSTLIGLVVCFAFLPTELLLSVGLAALSFYLENWKGLTYTNAAKKSGIFFGMMSGASLLVLCAFGGVMICCKGMHLCLWPCRHHRKLAHKKKRRLISGDETELLSNSESDDDDDAFRPYRPINSDVNDPYRDGEQNERPPLSAKQKTLRIKW